MCHVKGADFSPAAQKTYHHKHDLSLFARDWIKNCPVVLANQTREETSGGGGWGRLFILMSKMGFEEEEVSPLPLDMMYGLWLPSSHFQPEDEANTDDGRAQMSIKSRPFKVSYNY